jgi:hypothetical protein
MRKHNSAATDAQARCSCGDGADQRFRTGAGEPLRSVVLGNPVADVSEIVGNAGEVDLVMECIPRGGSLGNRSLIENTETEIRHFRNIQMIVFHAKIPGSD